MKKGLLFLVGISILFCSCSRRTKVDIESYEKEIDNMRKEVEVLERKLDFYKNHDEVKIMAYKSDDAKNRIDLNIVVPEYNKLELFLFH